MKVVSEDKKLVYRNIANKSQIGYYFALHKSWMGLKGPFISTPSFYSKENWGLEWQSHLASVTQHAVSARPNTRK